MALDGQTRRAFVAGGAFALGGGGLYFARSRGDDAGTESYSPSFHSSEETTGYGLDLSGKPLLGSADAPIDCYYWTDFQCPFCETFERETLPDLAAKHVDAGRLRIVFVPLSIFGADSLTAAVAARCVWDSVRGGDASAYWDWHGTIFAEQAGKNTGWASAENLVAYTRSVDGVDADALETRLADRREEFEAAVAADAEFATSIGVTGTPTFVLYNRETGVNGALVGAQPLDRFDEGIGRVESA